MVHPSYRMFALYDPTCAEPEDFEPAITGAIGAQVGWSAGLVAVSTELDLVRVTVEVEVWDSPPPEETARVDLRREHDLAFPSGQFALDKSPEESFLRGLDLPPGPGTYRCRLLGTGRARVREGYDLAYANGPGPAASRAVKALDAQEAYRFQLWHVADQPRWTEDDEDD